MICIVLACEAGASDALPGVERERPKIGLALSGGGTKAGAHIGVLRVLESLNIPIDYIAGTSAGAIVGGLYAAGLTPDEIETAFAGIDWEDILRDAPPRSDLPFRRKRDDENYLVKSRPGVQGRKLALPMGLIEGQKVTHFLRRHLPRTMAVDFDALPTPLRIVTTDLASGEPEVLSSGDLALAMRASMSIPMFFSPVPVGGKILVDGSVSNNLPVNLVRDMGADVVIAVDITAAFVEQEQLDSVLSVTDQLSNFLIRKNVDLQLRTLRAADILIQPDLRQFDAMDFEKTLSTVAPGERAARALSTQLKSLSVHPATYERQFLARRQFESPRRAPIAFIDINNASAIATETIQHRLDLHPGDPADRELIERAIARVYGLDLFQRIDYQLIERDSMTGVLIDVVPKPWGPDYLQFGLRLTEDFATGADFNVGIAYLRTAVNDLGGEWRTQLDIGEQQGLSVDWFQPLSHYSSFFLNLRAQIQRRTFRVFDEPLEESIALADLRISSIGGQLSVGMELGSTAELQIGWSRARGDLDRIVGTVDLIDQRINVGELFVAAQVDSLDNAYFPRTGILAGARMLWSEKFAGAEGAFRQASASYYRADSWGEYTLFSGMEAGITINENAPVQGGFLLGGLGRLSGYATDRLLGQHYGLASLIAYKRLRRSRWLPMYAGVSLELGNVWNDRSAMSVGNARAAGALFGGLDTPIGPVYLGWGLGQGGEQSVYLHLGSPFVARRLRPQD